MAKASAAPSIGVAAAPLYAPAHVGYAHAIPENIYPYASQYNFFNKALSPLVAAPAFAAAPAIAAPLAAAPLAAPIAAPYPFRAPIASPYVEQRLAAPLPSPFGPYASPYVANPFAYSSPLTAPVPFAPYQTPVVGAPLAAPAFVR